MEEPNGGPVHVRAARADDRPAIVALNVELQDFERVLRPSRRPGTEMALDYTRGVEKRLASLGDRGAMFVAELDGVVVGFCVVLAASDDLETERDEVLISDLVVTEGARGRGVGRALVTAGERFCRGLGIRRLVVSAIIENDDAVATYERLGFRQALVTLEKSV